MIIDIFCGIVLVEIIKEELGDYLKNRIDKQLVIMNLAPSRTKAKELIEAATSNQTGIVSTQSLQEV